MSALATERLWITHKANRKPRAFMHHINDASQPQVSASLGELLFSPAERQMDHTHACSSSGEGEQNYIGDRLIV
jgi:hypothetical protein